ncbi:uncharacterized mitochondrial protein AtMg00810-like [Juglans microcarpa x Juglans regia]|uniref:uncharacterized mitochondrial protein AtMg00810-like n=1 Tax=Juglans microcarpa x Juglans regia TaxID=2249226 RepID=UPI001B7F1227|nr:uncharacterized mitochondrial protein AtMg00810-like [Juglans microcarpa x Juglans regia]
MEDDKVVHEAGPLPTEEDLIHITSPISLHPTNQTVPSAKSVVNQVMLPSNDILGSTMLSNMTLPDPSLPTTPFLRPFSTLHVYVDDMIITSSSSSDVKRLIVSLGQAFPVTDLGPLPYFLGLELDYLSDGLFISQRKYISDLLKKANMLGSKPISSPMSTSTKLSKFDAPTFENATLFRSIVGSLQYLSLTRPDVSFAVNKVYQFMHDPKNTDWTAVKRILQYLKSTINHGLFLAKKSGLTLHAFSDADWAGCPHDRRSTRGFCIFLGNHLISWSSRKQHTLACSSIEAEYKSLANTTAELIWLQTLIKDLGFSLSQPSVLWCDNLGATYLSSNPIYHSHHSRTKHMDVDFHFVRDRVAAKTLQVQFCSNKDQLANVFTKPLVADRFFSLKSSLNVIDTAFDSRGRINLITEAAYPENTKLHNPH